MDFDLTIRNGRISTDRETFFADIGVKDGVIARIAPGLPPGREDIDAAGRWVLPGGIDSHCHIEQLSGMGMMCADDFYSGSVSAAFGGTTTIIPFAAQHRGNRIPDVIADYAQRAREKAVIDYGFHLILADPDEQALQHDLPQAIREGITSLKVYMTYNALKLDDYQLLDVMALAGREGALVMIHAENHDMIRWLASRLLDQGHTAPKFHAVAHDPLAEAEASHRAIALSRLIGVPVLIVHVAGAETVQTIRNARLLGAQIYAESCPQYLFLTAEDIDLPGVEGQVLLQPAAARCQRPGGGLGRTQGWHAGHVLLRPCPVSLRRERQAAARRRHHLQGNGQWRAGHRAAPAAAVFRRRAEGPLDIHEFVRLTATNHAHMYGLSHCKGNIAEGSMPTW
jgi:dihydropyrimidinase